MGALKKAFLANVSLVTILSTAFFTYVNHEPIKRMVGNVLYRDVPIAEGHFTDPYGLRVQTVVNRSGKREAYLNHRPTGTRIEVTEDMFPPTSSMLEIIAARYTETQVPADEGKAYLMQLHRIQEQLYRNMEY